MQQLKIEAHKVNVRFDEAYALSNATIYDIRQGEVLGLIGNNGSGKSTFLRLLSGLLPSEAVTTGGLLVNEVDVLPFYNRSLARQLGIYLVGQELSIVPNLTVLQNVFLGREKSAIWGIPSKKKQLQRFEEICEIVKWRIDPDDQVSDLSIQDYIFLSLLRVLASEAEKSFVLLDEPTVHLSVDNIKQLLSIIVAMKQNGLGLVIVSHRRKDLEDICDHVVQFEMGTVAKQYTKSEFGTKTVRLTKASYSRPVFSVANTQTILKFSALINHNQEVKPKQVDFSVKAGVATVCYFPDPVVADEVFNLVSGIVVKEKEASVVFDGIEIAHYKPDQRRLLGIGVVSNHKLKYGLFPGLTAHENLMLTFGAETEIIWSKKAVEISRKIVKPFQVDKRLLYNDVMQLSGGFRQRIILAREMHEKMRLVVMRSPLQGLDQITAEQFWRVINEIVSRGVGVLLISTSEEEMDVVANEVVKFI